MIINCSYFKSQLILNRKNLLLFCLTKTKYSYELLYELKQHNKIQKILLISSDCDYIIKPKNGRKIQFPKLVVMDIRYLVLPCLPKMYGADGCDRFFFN
uniref:Uncharacterized protein n=1 Tax=Solanum lycopersicum TaxID=4081 RepID=A0A3Q7H775_SOLLC